MIFYELLPFLFVHKSYDYVTQVSTSAGQSCSSESPFWRRCTSSTGEGNGTYWEHQLWVLCECSDQGDTELLNLYCSILHSCNGATSFTKKVVINDFVWVGYDTKWKYLLPRFAKNETCFSNPDRWEARGLPAHWWHQGSHQIGPRGCSSSTRCPLLWQSTSRAICSCIVHWSVIPTWIELNFSLVSRESRVLNSDSLRKLTFHDKTGKADTPSLLECNMFVWQHASVYRLDSAYWLYNWTICIYGCTQDT